MFWCSKCEEYVEELELVKTDFGNFEACPLCGNDMYLKDIEEGYDED